MVSMKFFEENVLKLKKMEINNEDKYYLGGLYNQVMFGDITIPNTKISDLDELGIWNEWNNNRGMIKEIARNKYCDYINTIINLQKKNIYKK
jgi:acyl-CoA-binding protein